MKSTGPVRGRALNCDVFYCGHGHSRDPTLHVELCDHHQRFSNLIDDLHLLWKANVGHAGPPQTDGGARLSA